MPANSSIEIDIRARDGFSPAFAELDRALAAAERSGGDAASAIADLREGLSRFAGSAGAAAEATETFAERSAGALAALGEYRQEFQAEQEGLAEESAVLHGERLAEIERDTQSALTETVISGLQVREAELSASFQRVAETEQKYRDLSAKRDEQIFELRVRMYRNFTEQLVELASSQGSQAGRISKSLAVAGALWDTYRAANSALANVPYPFNFAAAAVVLAAGLANVQKIRQVNAAHGGMEEVPADSTFLLQRGERVLSTPQNRDLTRFLEREQGGAGGGVAIQSLQVHVMENATAGQPLLAMSAADWRHVVTDKIIPALNELAALGIRPSFAEGSV